MTEAEAIARIHSVYPTGKKDGLTNMQALMAQLGDVHTAVPMIHVAGTNGKGSCCAMIERVLREAGYRTGLYTSPFIERYNERIRLNGVPVDGERLAALVERVWPAYEALDQKGIHITEFELGTALAFLAFAEEKVDIAVIEVGLGGRLDPTNIIRPLVSVITQVGFDHMQMLGDTLGEIALEKAGIMKRGVPVSLGPQEKEALQVLRAAARGLGIAVYDPDAEQVRETSRSITFTVSLNGELIRDLKVSLLGSHQAENACAALGALAALRDRGWQIPTQAIRAGMADVSWPGRLEYFGCVILDGAHNDPGVRALCSYADHWLQKESTVLLSGMMRDKDIDSMVARLAGRFKCVVCTEAALPRAVPAQELASAFEAGGLRAFVQQDPAKALTQARSLAGPDGLVMAAGSLYLIGALRTLLRREKEFAHVV